MSAKSSSIPALIAKKPDAHHIVIKWSMIVRAFEYSAAVPPTPFFVRQAANHAMQYAMKTCPAGLWANFQTDLPGWTMQSMFEPEMFQAQCWTTCSMTDLGHARSSHQTAVKPYTLEVPVVIDLRGFTVTIRRTRVVNFYDLSSCSDAKWRKVPANITPVKKRGYRLPGPVPLRSDLISQGGARDI